MMARNPTLPPENGRDYPDRPWVGIGVIAFRGDEVLLIRRGTPPYTGEWSIPGGAQRLGETAEDAARRELLEEAGIQVGSLAVALVADALSHDTQGKVRYHYTIIDYVAEWLSGEPIAGDDASDARWFAPAELGQLGLQPHIRHAIAEAIARRQR